MVAVHKSPETIKASSLDHFKELCGSKQIYEVDATLFSTHFDPNYEHLLVRAVPIHCEYLGQRDGRSVMYEAIKIDTFCFRRDDPIFLHPMETDHFSEDEDVTQFDALVRRVITGLREGYDWRRVSLFKSLHPGIWNPEEVNYQSILAELTTK